MAKQKTQTLSDKLKSNLSFQEELNNTLKTIISYKTQTEANIVSTFWKCPDLIFDYDEISTSDFDNNKWRVFYEILYQLVVSEDKKNIDDVTVGFYLEKHLALKQVYQEEGGYAEIQKTMEYIQTENLESYIADFNKWKKVKQLAILGYPVNNRLSEFCDKSIEAIYDEFEVTLNSIFGGSDFGVKSYDISDNIDNLIEKMNQEEGKGLPYKDLKMLTVETAGMLLGDITLIGGVSNSGKSTFLRLAVLPSILEKKEKIVIFLNEEGIEKWQKELLIWVANRIYAQDVQKWQVRNGKYDDEFKAILLKSAEWIKQSKENKSITLVPLQRYKTLTVAKMIKKYCAMGIKYFAIDTFKMDNADSYVVGDNTRLQMVQNMTNLYNIIKESNKNVHLICTVQLSKGSSKMRFLTLDSIGESKNIVDNCANAFFIRNIFPDEYPGRKHALQVRQKTGKEGTSEKIINLSEDKKYQILFIAKSRESAAGVGAKQLVLEVDFSRNLLKEVGYTQVEMDF